MRSIGLCLSLLFQALTLLGQGDSATLFSHALVHLAEGEYGDLEKFRNRSFKRIRADELYQDIVNVAYSEGYVLVQIERVERSGSLIMNVTPGAFYTWNGLRMNEETKAYMRKSGVNLNRFERSSVSPIRIGKAFNKTLQYLENHGFPFARIKLDSLNILETQVQAIIDLDKGPLILVDSLSIVGNLKVRKSYITNSTGIRPGDVYNEGAIKSSTKRLSQIGFVTEARPLEVRFNKDETKVTLFLDKKQSSRFDGIIGFLPDPQTGELLVTGDVSIHLENGMKQGEVIDLNWRRLQTNTQDLDAQFLIPYVLNSPLSPDGKFKIYRRDTSFTDVFGQVGLRYIFNQTNYVRAFVDRQVSNLISTARYENSLIIPEFLDRTITSYGLGLKLSRVNYALNPSKGYTFELEGAAGNKVILRNPAIRSEIYDSLTLTSLQMRSNLNASYYVSIVKRLVWHQRFLGGALINDQLFNNDVYRIGGHRSIRGFNEESIFATNYAIARSELRYQLDRDGFLFALFDQGWYENTAENRIGARRDTPYSLGLGVSLGTKAGIFSLATAVGSQQGNPLLIRAAKFHFGFLSVF
jgi:outer membrane protein assembly factor BamA